MEETTKIILIEDRQEFADKVQAYLSKIKSVEFLAHFYSVEEAFESPFTEMAELLLLDIGLPGINGIDALPTILNHNPQLAVIMLTVFEDEINLFNALKNGAKGYVLKGDCFMHLEQAIFQVKNGGMLFSPTMAKKVLKHFSWRPLSKIKITEKEKTILKHLSQGLTKKEMAFQLNIKYYTVDSHIKNIYKKLHVRSNVQAVCKANEEGLI
ncbi:MAG: response regulator transcription factor [Prolixibacteraceae bacterium]|jgi:DNA-binding NarL/FixJ family response regulator|nr:response regulator transcription factor [Prolixibacteraceae bacterium]